MNREKAILLGPFVGEFFWSFFRFAPILPYLRLTKYKGRTDIKYIVYTRPERFDLYGKYADILIPLNIEGDSVELLGNCYRLEKLSEKQYKNLIKNFYNTYKERFNIIEHIYPKIDKKNFLNKNQFNQKQMVFKYSPRKDNYDLVKKYILNDKPLVILAPRYRIGFKRNWPYWQKLYDMIHDSSLINDFNFVICGKNLEYIPDNKNRFKDINNILLTKNSSLAGLLIAVLEESVFCTGSQSALPNMALFFKTPVLEWGHQKTLHTKNYNINNTTIEFIEDRKYNISPTEVFKRLRKTLIKKIKKEN